MGRRHQHEEHANHEAWAIPYGDLVTLLLAFFVVMYAMSSVNEGKYRLLSDSLVAAFRGSPRTLQPVQVGEKSVGSGADINMTIVQQAMLDGQPRSMLEPSPMQVSDVVSQGARHASESEYEAETYFRGHRGAGKRRCRSRAGDERADPRSDDRGAPSWRMGGSRDSHRHLVPRAASRCCRRKRRTFSSSWH